MLQKRLTNSAAPAPKGTTKLDHHCTTNVLVEIKYIEM